MKGIKCNIGSCYSILGLSYLQILLLWLQLPNSGSKLFSLKHMKLQIFKWGEQSPDSWTGVCRKTAPNGQNDLKFCIQGAFAHLY